MPIAEADDSPISKAMRVAERRQRLLRRTPSAASRSVTLSATWSIITPPLAGSVAVHDPRERRHPHDGSERAGAAGAGDRRRAGRRRRRHARDRARQPRVVDLGGRCVLPGFTDSHVHFPSWALALATGAPRGNGLARRGARSRSGRRAHGRWSSAASAGATRTGPTPPTKEALDAVTGDRPAALFAHDYHSLWLNSAALALADGDLEVQGGVVERDASGEPTGDPPRGGGVALPGPPPRRPRRRVRRRDARGAARRRRARRDGRARQGRLARRRALLAAAARRGRAHAARVAVAAARAARPGRRGRPAAAGSATRSSGSATSRPSWTARSARRRRGCSTAPAWRSRAARSWRRSSARGARPAGRSPCTRSATSPTARRSTRSSRPRSTGARRACASGSSTRSASPRRTSRAIAALGVADVRPVQPRPSDRDLAERFWPEQLDGTYAFRIARRVRRARRERLGRADRGARPAGRVAPGSSARSTSGPPWRPEQARTLEQALHATMRHARRGSRATSGAAEAPARVLRRPRRARSRSARV